MPSPTRRPTASVRRRTGTFHRESTRLRSNVADQVQRDLLPAGRMLQVFLVVCELIAEVAVLVWSRGKECDRPLRFWVAVLIVLQTGTVLLNCLSILCGRDSLSQHRNGLSATDLGMYTDTPAAPPPSPPRNSVNDVQQTSENINHNDTDQIQEQNQSAVVDIASSSKNYQQQQSDIGATTNDDTRPLLASVMDQPSASNASASSDIVGSSAGTGSRMGQILPISTSSSSNSIQSQIQEQTMLNNSDLNSYQPQSPSESRIHSLSTTSTSSTLISTSFVDRYLRIVNLWYLVWFILGSVWVSDAGQCSTTAPHLYRLIVALTIIYYALLFLPLACFCLIVCCLPLFILVYRIMLPYAERERRRARAADPAQVRGLDSIVYSSETFANQTGSTGLEDASCVICLCDYEEDEVVRVLPCKHHFHKDCVDVWLRLDKACCLCKQDIDSQSNQLSSAV